MKGAVAKDLKDVDISEMYRDMSRYSSKTYSVVQHLQENPLQKRKSEYSWRKDVENFENSDHFKSSLRLKSIKGGMEKREMRDKLFNITDEATTTAVSNRKSRLNTTSNIENVHKKEVSKSLKPCKSSDIKSTNVDTTTCSTVISSSRTIGKLSNSLKESKVDHVDSGSNHSAIVDAESEDFDNCCIEKDNVEKKAGDCSDIKLDFNKLMNSLETQMRNDSSKLDKLRQRIKRAKGVLLESTA